MTHTDLIVFLLSDTFIVITDTQSQSLNSTLGYGGHWYWIWSPVLTDTLSKKDCLNLQIRFNI